MALLMASCGFDDEPSSNSSKDPEGTIIINFVEAESNVWYYVKTNVYFRWRPGFNMEAGDSRICVLGPVKNIASITQNDIPTTGWGRMAAAKVGYGYILTGCFGGYAALYVDSEIKSTSGGVYGYVIKARMILEED